MRKYRRAASRAAVKNNKFGPIILIGAGIFVILAVVIWQLSLLPTTTAAPIAGNFDIPYPEIKRVSLEDAKTALDTGGALILDVRDAGTFGSKHITGSINIPLNDLEKRANELPKDRWILTVCTWPAENSAARAASILNGKGFQNVNPVLGGFEAWLNAGYPTEP